jgi:uncharacterized phiE125 gp8 family phage protein
MSVTAGEIIDPVTFRTRNPDTRAYEDRAVTGALWVAGVETDTVVTITAVGARPANVGRYKASFTVPTVATGDELELVLTDTDTEEEDRPWREQGRYGGADAPAPATTPLTRSQRWSEIVAPVARPVTWAELKAQQRVATDAEQTFGELCIDAATEHAQDAMACSLMVRTLLATFYDGERIVLPRGPLIEVLGVTDRDDAAVTGFELAHAGHAAVLIPTSSHAGYPLSVTYRAGYATAAAVPADVRRAVLAHAGTLFENRESVTDKTKLPVPHSLEAFYNLKSRKVPVG